MSCENMTREEVADWLETNPSLAEMKHVGKEFFGIGISQLTSRPKARAAMTRCINNERTIDVIANQARIAGRKRST